ncbi:MAG: hypothetical protein LBK25_02535 [Treponema sp.]|nr:hypothetical protein [Treponema sp.]
MIFKNLLTFFKNLLIIFRRILGDFVRTLGDFKHASRAKNVWGVVEDPHTAGV